MVPLGAQSQALTRPFDAGHSVLSSSELLPVIVALKREPCRLGRGSHELPTRAAQVD